MQIRLFKATAGACTVYIKHAKRLKIRSCVLFCKDRAAVSECVKAEVKLEEDAREPVRERVF